VTGRTAAEETERGALHERVLAFQKAIETGALPRLESEILSMPLTIQQLKVLMMLVTEESGGGTVQGLASAMNVSLATMSGIVDRLTGHGMADRRDDPTDHRVRRVHATPLGRATAHRLIVAPPDFGPLILDRLPLEDLRALVRGLDAVLRVATSDSAGSGA
jgi:DNA-binding MarR family transcriptional regulator